MLQIQRLAAQTVANVLSGTSLNAALDSVWHRNRHLTAPDRGAIQDICYGTLRHLGKLSAVLDQLAAKPISSPDLRTLLLTVLYQLEYSEAAPYAVVDHAVECAAQLGGEHVKPFANAVLRNFQRRREGLLANAELTDEGRFSYPDWWVDRVRHDFGADAERILDNGNRHPPMTLRTNVRRGSVSDYLHRLQQSWARGTQARQRCACAGATGAGRSIARIWRWRCFGSGCWSAIRGTSAGCPRRYACAGCVRGAGRQDGARAGTRRCRYDRARCGFGATAARADRILNAWGLSARLQAADAAALDTWWDGIPFERVLVDAPCSASGVVRRHPDIKWLRRPSDIAGFAAQQQRLLEALWKVVARSGKLLYVTCSIFSEEDHETIRQFRGASPRRAHSGRNAGTRRLAAPGRRTRWFLLRPPPEGLIFCAGCWH